MSENAPEDKDQSEKGTVSPKGAAKYRNVIFGVILLVIISVVAFVLASAFMS